jgi:preprotein translocase subunit SecG
MSLFITILFVLTAVLLVGVVLIQQPKTAGGLFSGTGQSLLGTSGKSFWTKFTTVLAGVFMALCLLMQILPKNQPQSSVTEIIDKQQQAAQPPAQAAVSASAPTASNPSGQSKPAAQRAPNAPIGAAPPSGASK